MNTANLRKLEKHLDDFTSGFTVPTYVTPRDDRSKRPKSSRPQYHDRKHPKAEFYEAYLKNYIKQKQYEKIKKKFPELSDEEIYFMSQDAYKQKSPPKKPKRHNYDHYANLNREQFYYPEIGHTPSSDKYSNPYTDHNGKDYSQESGEMQ
jgi:hypothetical protein